MRKVRIGVEQLESAAEATESILVSVIVPVYNTPVRLLERCVSSIMGQTHRMIELLIVDDGSTGECAEYIGSLASHGDGRISVIQGRHKGVSNARNRAIDQVKGEFLVFVDSDDEVIKTFVEEALAVAVSNDCDLVCGSVSAVYAGSSTDGLSTEQDFDCYLTTSESLEDERRALALQMLGPVKYKYLTGPDFRGRGPVAKLYRASLLETLRFDETVSIGEDTLFNYWFILKSSSIAVADRDWYLYYQYAVSSVHGVDLRKWEESIDALLCAGKEENQIPFLSRCAFMATQGVSSIAAHYTFFPGLKKSAELLEYAAQAGCFDPPVFQGFCLSPWLSIMIWLCRHRSFTVAYCFWRLKNTFSFVTLGKRLIDSKK